MVPLDSLVCLPAVCITFRVTTGQILGDGLVDIDKSFCASNNNCKCVMELGGESCYVNLNCAWDETPE